MHVRLGGGGHVVVHHVRHVLDVEPACGNVRRDEQFGRVCPELLHDAVALLLRQAAVQRLSAIATAIERLGELVHLGAGAAEHDCRRRILDVEHATQCCHLVRAAHDVGRLAHARRGPGGNDFAIDAHPHRILEVLVRDVGDARGQCRREERRLAFGGSLDENGLEVLGETHIEHLVRLVEDDDPHTVEAQCLAPDVIQRAPRCGDNDVHTALQCPELRLHRCAAIDGQRNDSQRLPILVHRFGHLHRELTRRHEDQRAQPFARLRVRCDEMQEGECEGRSLSGAGRRLPQQVAALEERRNRLPLHRRGLLVTKCGQRIDNSWIEAEAGKTGGLVGAREGCGLRCHP